MPEDFIRYDLLTQTALRGVMRTVLADVAKKGLPGEHHFKITFMTTAPGVRLPERVRAQYPQTMTIILQHQFWDLTVREESFDVGLAFSGIPERLTVPFEAVSAFFDPAVQFGFQFEVIESAAPTDAPAAPQTAEKTAGAVTRLAGEAGKPESLPAALPAADPAAVPPATSPDSGGEVVRLDRFRKK